MRQFLLRSAAVLPLLGMFIPIMVGLCAPGYSSIQQHMSELELLSPGISLACRFGAIISGLSIIGFALGLLLSQGLRMPFTAAMAVILALAWSRTVYSLWVAPCMECMRLASQSFWFLLSLRRNQIDEIAFP
jgi:hypothetical protein